MPTTRAISYIRISELTDATTSPERQRQECERYAEGRGWEVVGVYEDLDVSGTKSLAQRPGMAGALAAIEAGEADVLVSLKIDRVARSVITFQQIVERVYAAGGSLVLVAEQLDFSTPSGRMVANVLSAFAEYESQSIGSRVKAAQQHLASVGKWRGGQRPFGWTPVQHESGQGRKLVHHSVEAPILLEIATRVAGGESFAAIAADLNGRGVLTARGHAWTFTTISQVLSKPALTGRDGAERLLSDQDYATVQHTISSKAGARPRPRETFGLAAGLAECGRCGYPLRVVKRDDRDNYRCTKPNHPGIPGCNLSATQRGVDAAVEAAVLKVVGRAQVEIADSTELVDLYEQDRKELREALRSLEADRYIGGLFKGTEGEERFRAIYADVEARLAALPEPQVVTTSSPETIPTGERFADAWAEASEATRAGWLATMLDSVVVHSGKGGHRFDPSRVELRWRS